MPRNSELTKLPDRVPPGGCGCGVVVVVAAVEVRGRVRVGEGGGGTLSHYLYFNLDCFCFCFPDNPICHGYCNVVLLIACNRLGRTCN